MNKCLVLLAVLGLLAPSVSAQSVIFQVSGQAYARDWFGGGGVVQNLIDSTVGTNLTQSASAINGGAFSSAIITALGDTATFSVETLSETGFGGGFNLFIFEGIAEAFVDAYILGAPGTPYDLTVTGTGALQVIDAGAGSAVAEAGTLGVTDPGFAFTWGFSGGTYSISSFTDSNTLLYGGQTYSRVRPMARTSARSFFGISGTSGFPGFGSYHATQSVTMTVNNLAVVASAPEPGTLIFSLSGGLIWLLRRRRDGSEADRL